MMEMVEQKLSRQGWMEAAATRAVVEAFALEGESMRFVGGAVRDAVLGRAVKDIDIATPATPERVMALMKKAGIKVVPTGIVHGTVTAVSGGAPYEITTLRTDVACDGRWAEVTFTDDWQVDASRRDFTLNALYLDADGTLVDYFGGVADAKAGVVRFIGEADQRIREDALRILRLFRFHAHYGQGELDRQALAACARHVGMIDALSGERIQHEMMKLLAAPDPTVSLLAMREAGVLAQVLPVISGVEKLTALVAVERAAGVTPDALRRLAFLLRDGGRDAAVEWVREQWKISRKSEGVLTRLVVEEPALRADMGEAEAKAAMRSVGAEIFRERVLLAWAEKASGGDVTPSEAWKRLLALEGGWKIPVFPLAGEDLKKAGYEEGKELGEALARAEKYWEAEDYTPGKKELLAWLGKGK